MQRTVGRVFTPADVAKYGGFKHPPYIREDRAVSRERRLGRGLEALLGRAWDDAERSDKSLRPWCPFSPFDSSNASRRRADYARRARPGLARLRSDRAQSVSAAADLRRDRNCRPGGQHSHARHPAAAGGAPRRRGFELVAGERRLRAAQAADWRQVPVQIRDVDDRQMAELAIVENVQRKDLNAIEKAESFQRYIEQYQCTQEELAARVQIDRSTVANLIRLLELPGVT